MTVVEAPESDPIPTLTFSRPRPEISAEPETTSIATPVSKKETSLIVRSFVERIPVAVFVMSPVSMVKMPWLTTD